MNGPLWGNAVLTFDLFQDDVVRQVPLGIYTDTNYAHTTGNSMALALRGGRDFNVRETITTGPVLGLVMQQVSVAGFTETGDTGITALAFDHQTRDSLVGQLGWRVLSHWGKFQPFAEGTWNHEWADRNRTVTTSLTTVTAPSYSLFAAPVATDWGTFSMGAYYQLNRRVLLRGSTSAMFANPQMNNYGGEFGLNICF